MLGMHLSLVKFLFIEIPKQKTPSAMVMFLKKITIEYGKVMLREYKNIFLFLDPDYQKQKKIYNNQQEIKKALQTALKMLKYIDKKMIESGKSRQERKLFWRDFYKRGEVRAEKFQELEKEINQIRS